MEHSGKAHIFVKNEVPDALYQYMCRWSFFRIDAIPKSNCFPNNFSSSRIYHDYRESMNVAILPSAFQTQPNVSKGKGEKYNDQMCYP